MQNITQHLKKICYPIVWPSIETVLGKWTCHRHCHEMRWAKWNNHYTDTNSFSSCANAEPNFM